MVQAVPASRRRHRRVLPTEITEIGGVQPRFDSAWPELQVGETGKTLRGRSSAARPKLERGIVIDQRCDDHRGRDAGTTDERQRPAAERGDAPLPTHTGDRAEGRQHLKRQLRRVPPAGATMPNACPAAGTSARRSTRVAVIGRPAPTQSASTNPFRSAAHSRPPRQDHDCRIAEPPEQPSHRTTPSRLGHRRSLPHVVFTSSSAIGSPVSSAIHAHGRPGGIPETTMLHLGCRGVGRAGGQPEPPDVCVHPGTHLGQRRHTRWDRLS